MSYNTLDKRREYYKQYAINHAVKITARSKKWYLDNKARHTVEYVPGNVRVISFRANRLKSSMSFAEIERLHQYVSQK